VNPIVLFARFTSPIDSVELKETVCSTGNKSTSAIAPLPLPPVIETVGGFK